MEQSSIIDPDNNIIHSQIVPNQCKPAILHSSKPDLSRYTSIVPKFIFI